MISKKVQVLDSGHVQLISYFGSDQELAAMAGISYGKQDEKKSAADVERILRHLYTSGHESIFEHIVMKFRVKLPIFVARQWFRHRIASYDEKSGRYTAFDNECYFPSVFRKGIGTGGRCSRMEARRAQDILDATYSYSYDAYQKLLGMGIAKEQARIVLPQAMYTEFYWTVNGRSLLNFFRQRLDRHAQYEIRQYAAAVFGLFEECYPVLASVLPDTLSRGVGVGE
jgi:thymidylate synthase (FAD)